MGYDTELESILESIETDTYDFHESYYNMLVIEKINAGFSRPKPATSIWFEWVENEQTKSWVHSSKPKNNRITIWAIG